jgi:3-methyladenine DNA glycosylase AlkD
VKDQQRLTALLKEIRAFCAAHADEKQAKKYGRYFTEGYDPYGVPDTVMKPQREKWLAGNPDLGLAGFLDLGDRLYASGKYEEGMMAVAFAARFLPEFTPTTFERVGKWLDAGVRNWAHSDVLCGNLLTPCLVNKVVGLDAMDEWRRAPSRWKRRAIPVTLIGLVKTGAGCRTLLDFVEPLMMDDERVVHQGLGWFLREAWKKEPKPTEQFLLRWKDKAARLIFQYATEKMTAAGKARFRAAKAKT